jgi:hypothetical protein
LDAGLEGDVLAEIVEHPDVCHLDPGLRPDLLRQTQEESGHH